MAPFVPRGRRFPDEVRAQHHEIHVFQWPTTGGILMPHHAVPDRIWTRFGPRLALALSIAAGSVPVAARAADEIHWTLMGQTAVTIDWRGSESTVRYGLTTSYGQTVTAQTPSPLPFSSAGPFWEARITGLQENTLYHYSVGTGPDHTFRTPPPRGSSDFSL